MDFDRPLLEGVLVRRYKRFLADVELADGNVITAHTPNTGSMLGCCEPGSRVWLSESDNPRRKYRHGWELVEAEPDVLVGINTGRANGLVEEAITGGVISELQDYPGLRREVRYGTENSRIDLLLHGGEQPECYVEVKNVTLAEDGIAFFPDAVSTRGSKHLRELSGVRRDGRRAAIVFCVQRGDVSEFRPADAIDTAYGATLRRAAAEGVETLAYRARVSAHGVHLEAPLPVVLP